MKIKFENNLDYQIEAINSITDIFQGQEIEEEEFSLGYNQKISNKLLLNEEEILKNVQNIQNKNLLNKSSKIDINNLHFSIEMETGTGKTYVFLRTILELNKKYGFNKFIIVVPSIAIKEGIKKTLDITKNHFRKLYDNPIYEYFIYNSDKLNQIKKFMDSNFVQIMIMNIDSFNKKDINVMNKERDSLQGKKPIDLISSTKPIIIIDEPQSVDTTEKSKNAIKSLNPLFVLRYSATHRDKYNLMYSLNAVDAYQKKLVKQIVVNDIDMDRNNSPYIKLVKINKNKQSLSAKIEIIKKNGDNLSLSSITCKKNDSLYKKTKNELYKDYIISDIYAYENNQFIEFLNGETLKIGEILNGIDEDKLQYLQIKQTIKSHLDRELSFLENNKNIKVLSLFFIDKVSNYRSKNNDAKFVTYFNQSFKELIKKEKYKFLLNEYKKLSPNLDDEEAQLNDILNKIHDGYFSKDKGEFKDTDGNSKKDEETYEKIMKNKEKLLSLDEPLRFIFSHSALREGWDNPNVFQICTLNETKSEIKKRQEIGRGLRLCVDTNGERVKDENINILTIVTNENYETFAKKLQKEYENDLGIKFGIVELHTFHKVYDNINKCEQLLNDLENEKYIIASEKDDNFMPTDRLIEDLKNNRFRLNSSKYNKDELEQIEKVLKQVTINIKPKSQKNKKTIKLVSKMFENEEFTNLWNKIKQKTIYNVEFDVKTLKEKCIKEIKENIAIEKPKIKLIQSNINISQGGVEAIQNDNTILEDVTLQTLPDIITELQKDTTLKREDIIDILINSNKLDDFKNNPSQFIKDVKQIIKSTLKEFLVDGVKYQKIEEEYLLQEIFDKQEIETYSKVVEHKNNKSLYTHTICDSTIEEKLAKEFDNQNIIKFFVKLPPKFKINTPIGSYNPDWAVVVKQEEKEKIYFVIESKGTNDISELRPNEQIKIKCAKKHFQNIEELKYEVIKNFESLQKKI